MRDFAAQSPSTDPTDLARLTGLPFDDSDDVIRAAIAEDDAAA